MNYNLSVAWLMKKEQTLFPSGLCFYLFSLLYLKEAEFLLKKIYYISKLT